MSTRQRANKRGAAIAETAAALAVLVPLVVLLIYAIAETSTAYHLQAVLSEAARKGARNLAVQYGIDPTIAKSPAMQETQVFDLIRMPNVISSSSQFSAYFDTSSTPGSVTVAVKYAGGTMGLPPFPNPDPLGLGNFVLTARSTYRLE